jgi:hypothetical protein
MGRLFRHSAAFAAVHENKRAIAFFTSDITKLAIIPPTKAAKMK